MTRTVVTAGVILLLTVSVGCDTDRGLSRRLPQRTSPYATTPEPAATEASIPSDELDLVEQMASHRLAYRRSLETLVTHYTGVGNNEKLSWAREELRALDRIPQYRYVAEADIFGPELKATARIPAADELFEEARAIEREASPFPVLRDEELLRAALVKYGELIRRYPTSDKIDDAAYRMAIIHDYFNDHTIALRFYQRTYQWDPDNPYPARFKAASILDRKLHRRDEALALYQEAVIKEAQHDEWRMSAEHRIKTLSRSNDGG
jgi:tetratricopeptide (TPR) repeat protein